MFFRLFVTLVAVLFALASQSCSHSPTGAVATELGFARSALVGVWEVVSCESLVRRGPGSPATTPNSKYCFNAHAAYPDLAADAANDSADGGGDYELVGGDVLVIRTGVPEGIYRFRLVSISTEQIVWQQDQLRVTLRRVAGTWDGGHAPTLRPRNIRISYPPF